MTFTRVAVIFEPGKQRPAPKWFSLDGQIVRVTEVTYYWESFEGAAKLGHYSVLTDAAGLCELIYNSHKMIWSVFRRGDNIQK